MTAARPAAKPGAGAALLLAGLVVAAYLPALSAGFVWNDDTYLTQNRTLDDAKGLVRIWTDPRANEQYYPLVFTSFWLEKKVFGLEPAGYHAVNVLLHAAAALLLWRLLRRLALPGAWVAAALFALHPLCVESVAWITERKNTLSLVFSLLSMLACVRVGRNEENEEEDVLRKVKRGETGRERAAHERRPLFTFKEKSSSSSSSSYSYSSLLFPSSFAFGLSFLFFVLALLSKTTAVVVPFALVVVLWFREGKLRRNDVVRLAPWFAVGAAFAAHTAWLERTSVLAVGREWDLSLAERLALAGQTAAFYAAKFVAPFGLSFVYPRWRLDAGSALQWLPTLAAAALLAALWLLRARTGRGPFAALVLFLGALFPAMGFFNVYPMRFSWVADHFAYQAVAVLAACVVSGAAAGIRGAPENARRISAVFAVGVLVLFGTLTARRVRVYASEETLWTDALAKNPACFLCRTNYGIWLLERGRNAEAEAQLEESNRLKPGEVPTLLNLALADERLGRFDRAPALLREAVGVDPKNAAAWINLGNAEARAGRVDDAVAAYREALRLGSPGDAFAHNGLGAALMRKGEPEEAIAHFREAVRLRPDYASARTNLERALSARAPAASGARAPSSP